MRLSIQTKLFLSHFAAIILVSGSVGSYFYHSAIDNLIEALRSRLQNSAALISSGLDVENLDQIHSIKDIEKPNYRDGVNALREFVKSNPDIAFIYVMRKISDTEVVFVLDSDTDEPAMPGEVYEDVVPQLLEGFIRPSVDKEITTDRWGSFLSGYSPLDVGQSDYLVGIDMYADEVESKLTTIRLTGLLSLTLSIFLAIFFSRVLTHHFTRRINKVVDNLSKIAPNSDEAELISNQGDELQRLSDSFDNMTVRLKHNRKKLDENQAALQAAKDELENRVQSRTSDLVEANQKLLLEITERRKIEKRLEKQSQTDYLTDTLNRRAMTMHLEQLSNEAQKDSDCFSIILTDLDHFKPINDNFGHDVGDQTLKHVAKLFTNGIRDHDLLSRWGGEEFLILLPHTQITKAEVIAQRLCVDLAHTQLNSVNGPLTVTASFGISHYRIGENLDQCLKRADDALYDAKSKGRNQVIAY